jgi:hypothetical protein
MIIVSCHLQVTTCTGPLLAPKPTRVQDARYEMEPQKVNQNANGFPLPSQSATVCLCPIPISVSTTGPGAGLLSFGTVVEPDVLPDDHRI